MMPKKGKKYLAARAKVEPRPYQLADAVKLVRDVHFTKFDESVDLALLLGVDPKHADQMVRGTVVLPHGTGKSKRVAVIAGGEKVKEAQEAGADHVGAEDLAKRIEEEGFTDFDVAIATPDMMPVVGRLGRVLGPQGKMPNPKVGTVTNDVAKAVSESKAGKVEYRTDRHAIVHMTIGKLSFDEQTLLENYAALVDELMRARPAAAKGRYLQTITLTTTMGPGVKVDPARTRDIVGEPALA
jgi:large subunit ribosomal protein L1